MASGGITEETGKSLEKQLKRLSDNMEKNNNSFGSSSDRSSRNTSRETRSTGTSSSSRFSIDENGIRSILKTNLSTFIEDAVLEYGGLIDYGSSQIENRASVTIKRQAETLTEMALDLNTFIGDKSVQQVFGNADKARRELAEIYQANTYYLNKIGMDYKDAEDAGASVMMNSLLVQKALRMNSEDFSKIIEHQMASSKKYTNEVFEEIAFYADAYSAKTGASIYQITNQLAFAVGEFDTFGGASTENLGKLAGMMGALEMDTKSISGLTKSMQSFEGATNIARDLAGAFGAVIDPLKLMGDSISDPAEALNSIRQAMLDAGHTSESLGFKTTLLAQTLNMSTSDVKRFLDGTIDTQALLADSVEATADAAAEADRVISKHNDSLVDNRTLTETIADIAESRSEVMYQGIFKKLNQFQTDANQLITGHGAIIAEMFPDENTLENFQKQINMMYHGPSEAERKAAAENIEKMFTGDNLTDKQKEMFEPMLESLRELNASDEIGKLQDVVSQDQRITYTANIDADAVNAGLSELNKSKELQAFITEMEKPFAYTRRQSPSQFEEDTIENIAVFKKITGELKEYKWLGAVQKEVQDTTRMIHTLNDGILNLEKTAENSSGEVVKKLFGDISSIPDSNRELVEEIRAMRQEMKSTKYVANITNDGTYNVVLGDEFKTAVRQIAQEKAEELFNATRTI
jgi:hypothetical protein